MRKGNLVLGGWCRGEAEFGLTDLRFGGGDDLLNDSEFAFFKSRDSSH
jgi:hypothetical protein